MLSLLTSFTTCTAGINNEVLLKYKAPYWYTMDKVKQTCELWYFARGSPLNNWGSYRLCGLPPICCASLLLQALFAALCSKWRWLDGGIVEEDSWQAFFKSTSPSTAAAPPYLICISRGTIRIQRVWNKLRNPKRMHEVLKTRCELPRRAPVASLCRVLGVGSFFHTLPHNDPSSELTSA